MKIQFKKLVWIPTGETHECYTTPFRFTIYEENQELFLLETHSHKGLEQRVFCQTLDMAKGYAQNFLEIQLINFIDTSEPMKIPLTQGKFALVDYNDYLLVASNGPWRYDKGYARKDELIDGKKTTTYLHRFLMNAKKGEIIDHADGDGLNNRRSNLRFCDHFENMRNRKLSKNNTTGFKGVVFNGSSWIAQMRHNKETIYLGSYGSPIEAAKAYNKAASERQGKFAKLNQIPAQ